MPAEPNADLSHGQRSAPGAAGRSGRAGAARLTRADAVALAAALAAACSAHAQALESGFRHDDFLFFYQAANLPLLDFAFTPHGGHLLMVRNLVFAAAFALFGLTPQPYFVLALASHALNVALLFYVVRCFSGRTWAACLAAALWGMAPFQQGTINWVSQYAGLLATTFTLVVLADLARHAASGRRPAPASGVLWGALLICASTSWGSGLAAALLMGPVAWLCMPAACGRLRTAGLLAASAPLLLAGFALFSGGGVPVFGEPFPVPLTLELEAFFKLVGYGVGALWLGPWGTFADEGVVMGPLAGAPLGDVVAAVGVFALPLFALLGFAWLRADAQVRLQLLGFAALAAGSYAAIALARIAVTVVFGGSMDFLAQSYRYHYFATVPIAVCVGLVLVELERAVAAVRGARGAGSGNLALAALLVALAVLTPFSARAARRVGHDAVEPSRAELRAALARLDRALEGRVPGQTLYLENDPSRALLLIPQLYPRRSFPGSAALYAFAYLRAGGSSEPVLFIERDVELVRELRANPRARIARMLVTPDEAAAGVAPGAGDER